MLRIESLEFINSSLLKSQSQVIHELVVENDTDEILQNLSLMIEGEYVKTDRVEIANLMPMCSVSVNNVDVVFDLKGLVVDKPTDIDFSVSLFSGGELLEFAQHSVCFLPDNYWDFRLMPETLVAHIMPKDNSLSGLVGSSVSVLKNLANNDSFFEYQTGDPNNVRAQVASLYTTLASQAFKLDAEDGDSTGQFMRMPAEIIAGAHGTNLDLTILFASALEHIGLHPIVAFINHKSLIGAWLAKENRPTAYNDEISSLLNLSADGVNRMVLVDPVAIVDNLPFEDAVNAAELAIRKANVSESECCYIDVHTARLENYQATEKGAGPQKNPTNEVRQQETFEMGNSSSAPTTKHDLWERKLLDFSLRNSLINMRKTSVLPFISFGVDELENKLQRDCDIQILSYPKTPLPDPDATGFYLSASFQDSLEELALTGVEQNRLYAFRREEELNSQLKNLYRSSRVALEENGASTLFLNLGMLRWYESRTSVVPRHAPLVLLPVDLIRKGGSVGYLLRLRDEEPMFNITLVEYLKQNFSVELKGLFPLPKDEAGLDIKKIFAIIRHNIAEQPRWDLIEEIGLGLFSFNKFVMWNDIHSHKEALAKNNIIRSLLEGKMLLDTDVPPVPAKRLDEIVAPVDVALPVDVDSSQLESIVDAGNGRSFILYGPPGTGKSQTITNMIANALYRGKRVLFVAEKRAALEVVESRLSKIGLAPFCLELHSNKVSKQHVLQQLQQATEVRHIKHPENFEADAESAHVQRQKLMLYIQQLHQKQSSGISLYDCITRFLSIPGDEVRNTMVNVCEAQISEIAEKLASFDVVFKITGHPSSSPLKGLEPKSINAETLASIKALVHQLLDQLSQVEKCYGILTKEYGISIADSYAGWQSCSKLAHLFAQTSSVNAKLIEMADDEQLRDEMSTLFAAGERRDTLRAELTNSCSEDVFTLDVKALKSEYQQAQIKWFLPRFFALNTLYRKLLLYKATLRKDEIPAFIQTLADFEKSTETIKQEHAQLEELFGLAAREGKEQWQKMSVMLQQTSVLLASLKAIDNSDYAALKRELLFAADKWDSLYHTHAQQLPALANACCEFCLLIDKLHLHADCAINESMTLAQVNEYLTRWNNSIDSLKDWCQYTVRKNELVPLGLAPVFDYLVTKTKSGAETAEAFRKGVYHQLAMQFIDSSDELRMFNGLLFEEQIQKYREIVCDYQELTKKEVYCRLAARVPSLTVEAASNSEVGILRRNIANGARGNSIRHLIDQIPTLLPKLCPCMLMSPLSVAQYLDIETQKFDLVVFDEASQMPTPEAIGAIARGNALVVVGDPKQMPPTSFFQVQQVDDDEADLDDLDSILDDCISLSMPEHYLSWHYRSRHESLISFSNHQYYDGRLMTFPSADNRASKVRLIHIDGTYDKGKTRCNRAEAEAIVAEVLDRLRKQLPPTQQVDKSEGITITMNVKKETTANDENRKSIGIVSFSKVQQNLIEDILIEALDKEPELKEIAYNEFEPIFVKNLENVQGDERDIILFSVGYGPDSTGHVSMNFGPLNKQGGERRLNVAVSRARYEMVIYSTLEPEQIDLKRTKARGVEGLKRFLEFAREGRMPIPATHTQASAEISGLVNSIAEVIKSMGYQVDTMIGSSHFRVDLAVVNPSAPGEYLLGILCDGANYYSTPTARDRNVVQPQVLAGLGWNLIRVWSVDWFTNKQHVVTRLQEALVKAEAGEPVSAFTKLMATPLFSVEDDPIEETEAVVFEKKDIENVLISDLIQALVVTLEEQVALPEDELKRQASKRLGYARMGVNVEMALTRALANLLFENKVTKSADGNIALA